MAEDQHLTVCLYCLLTVENYKSLTYNFFLILQNSHKYKDSQNFNTNENTIYS